MTKNQRNILELAITHTLLDTVLQGDSWGHVDSSKTAQEMFVEIGDEVRSMREMDDVKLMEFAGRIANEDPMEKFATEEGGIEVEVPNILSFESYDELYHYVYENLDGGDLTNQTVLDVLYLGLK